jgi:quercetin dioxygenase-like cupin family protein
VLEAEAGSEVIEISSPAEHETWVDHEMHLPTDEYRPSLDFGGQKFVRHVAEGAKKVAADGSPVEIIETDIKNATGGLLTASIERIKGESAAPQHIIPASDRPHFFFVLDGRICVKLNDGDVYELSANDSVLAHSGSVFRPIAGESCTFLNVGLPPVGK